MKFNKSSILGKVVVAMLLISPCFTLGACAEEAEGDKLTEPLVPQEDPEEMLPISLSEITTTTVFNSGSDGVNTYRIPTIATAVDGSLLVAGEARYTTWSDKTNSDVYLKRSTDGGATWSELKNITGSVNGGGYAFMDPLLIVDKNSGKIWLFACRWIANNSTASNNRAFVSVSLDNGNTWSTATDVTDEFVTSGSYISGFGPGSGFQIADGIYEDRLIVPTRQTSYSDSGTTTTVCTAVYSDNSGTSWTIGTGITPSGECQMADCGDDKLTLNIRASGYRSVGTSKNGGSTWSTPSADGSLPGVSGGCQASVLGVGGTTVLFCGIEGGTATDDHDNRCKLAIYRSTNGASTWPNSQLLYEKAAGYCCITTLNDGRVAVVFEAGDDEGFTKVSSRPAGWMRLDVMILPKEVTDSGYWFEE